jgi:hypothetical protein
MVTAELPPRSKEIIMPTIRHFPLPAAALLVAAAACRAESIAIINPGFEQTMLVACGFNSLLPGWSAPSGGTWKPGGDGQCLDSFLCGPPQGVAIAYTNGTAISQVLTATLEPEVEYILRVAVGRRGDGSLGMTDYAVQLRAGGTLLAEDAGTQDLLPGEWVTSTVTFTAPADHPALGQPLEIRLVKVAGVQGNFDYVRLDTVATTEPAPGDLDADGDVDGIDLATLLGSWGACPPKATCPCDADLNGSGAVTGIDLAILLGSWG